jgi:hypothetical protein
MTPLGNISLNKILKKNARMFMKQNYGHAFQLVKGCSTLTCINELNGKVSNIATHGKGEGANVPRFMLSGIFA